MAAQYFIHSHYGRSSNKKEKAISDYLRSLDGCLLVGEPDQELLREVNSRVRELNEEFPRSRALDVCLHHHLQREGYTLCVGNGTGSSVSWIIIQKVTSTMGYGD